MSGFFSPTATRVALVGSKPAPKASVGDRERQAQVQVHRRSPGTREARPRQARVRKVTDAAVRRGQSGSRIPCGRPPSASARCQNYLPRLPPPTRAMGAVRASGASSTVFPVALSALRGSGWVTENGMARPSR